MDGETIADDSASGNSQVPATQTAASTQSAAQTAVATQSLNDARRPQRLFGKVNAAMNLVKKRLSDSKYTKIGEFLSDAKMAQFLAAVRILIRDRLNGTIDTWPVREIHDYRPDIRYAILRAIEENWHLFGSEDYKGDLDVDGTVWEGDETVLSDMVFAPFYEE